MGFDDDDGHGCCTSFLDLKALLTKMCINISQISQVSATGQM